MNEPVIQALRAAIADTEKKIATTKQELTELKAQLRRYNRALKAVSPSSPRKEKQNAKPVSVHAGG
jgi:septal ring factor EnvC (AmiA/AmiB activator)